ncbi:MAG: efflux RND transporter periplasmic adaptor subunit [Pirellulales bacterium]
MSSEALTSPEEQAAPVRRPAAPAKHGPVGGIWSKLQFLVAFSAALAFLGWLLFAPNHKPSGSGAPKQAAPEAVKVVAPGLIQVRAGGPFTQKLTLVQIHERELTDAVLTVTGRVAASLRPGSGKGTDFWQFDAPEALVAYTDWQKARADISYSDTQLTQVRQLAATRVDAQRQLVARLEKLVAAGTDTPRELAAERATLIQSEIVSNKEVYEAETAARVARRSEAATARQLLQLGLDPEMLQSASSDLDVVLADVPEGRLNQVQVGQRCEASFYGLPHERFVGRVRSIAPVLSRERRSLRVLFVINDPKDLLRPGMFAEIGLGTDPRKALLAPTEGVLHLGRKDYLLAEEQPNLWRVTEVNVGEPHNGEVEILEGVRAGQTVIGKGAILLKPMVARALAAPKDGAVK